MSRPIIGVTACIDDTTDSPWHRAGHKYLQALRDISGCQPLIIPAMAEKTDIEALTACIDGLLLTGSDSNIHPNRYDQKASAEHEPFDLTRDATIFPLIRAVINKGIPLFGICRGFQELNVACGGSLFAKVHEIPGRMDHRRVDSPLHEVQYGPQHSIKCVEGGMLAGILKETAQEQVNSLHFQAIDKLGEGLAIEALAPDNTIEAISMPKAKGFCMAVQWHPEFKAEENKQSIALLNAFGEAVYQYNGEKNDPQYS